MVEFLNANAPALGTTEARRYDVPLDPLNAVGASISGPRFRRDKMKLLAAILLGGAMLVAAPANAQNSVMGSTADRIKDIGPQPQSFDIERATKCLDFRSATWPCQPRHP